MTLELTQPDRKQTQLHGRSTAIDRARGLAIVCMVVDHVALLFLLDPLDQQLRLTIGRLAMPLFFLIAGHLFRRLSWRHFALFVLGMVLPLVVPWLDAPNVLEWYVMGCLTLAVIRWADIPGWLLVAVALSFAANGWRAGAPDTSYVGASLIALMVVGASIPRDAWSWAERLPQLLAPVGRFPLSMYVGHVLVLQGVLLWVLA